MKRHNRSNALLVELLIVIIFFMLSSTVLLRVFATSHMQSERAGLITRALTEAQNAAETLYAAPDTESALMQMGFADQNGTWTLEKDGYCLSVVLTPQISEAGTLQRCAVSAFSGEDELFTLPVTHYEEARP